MLKLGEKIISNIYLGDKKIAKAFLGDKLVYQADKPLFLEYVESTGTQYIDTGVPANVNTIVEYTFSLAQVPTSGGLFGSGTSQSSTDRFQGYYESSAGFSSKLASTTSFSNVFITANTKHYSKMGIPLGGYYIDETFVSSATGTPSDLNLYIFGRNIAGKFSNPTSLRLYSFKISENETLIRDFRPCLDPKGTVCFYDMVTKKYFYNKGTGTLKAGGRFVESIVSDGNCYIDTGIKASYDYTIKTKYMYTSFVGAYNCIFGTRSEAVSEGNKIYWVGCNANNSKDLMLRMGKTTLPYSLKLNEVIDLEITPNEAIINGTNLGDAMFDGEIGFDSSIYLFNINMNSDGSTALFASVARMYNFQIYNNNMELIQDLRPYVDENGVPCFYDMVTNVKFYNKGTGTLSYTE